MTRLRSEAAWGLSRLRTYPFLTRPRVYISSGQERTQVTPSALQDAQTMGAVRSMQEASQSRAVRMRRLGLRATAGLAWLGLAACSPAETAALAGLSALSLLGTDKFLSDHIISQATGKDCSTLNALEEGRFCKDEEFTVAQAVQAPTYCYRTLGEITCYTAPNPYDSRSQLVQWPREP